MKIGPGGVSLCRGCDPGAACKLGITQLVVQIASQTVTSSAQCPPEWEGGPGVAHGGWIAYVFDDVLGMLPCRLDVPCVTASLNVEFLKPIPIKRPILVSGRVESHVGRRWVVTGVMRLAHSDTELARATIQLVEPGAEHFKKVQR